MLAQLLIERKRDGARIEPREWRALVDAYAAGDVPDYQMAALLMAIFFRGLARDEVQALTDAMLRSGATLDLSHLAVGGVAVPMMSGRGLGHTGGTLDKLESIPGFRTDLPLAAAAAQVERLGCALIGQTREIAPADRKMYALRDATCTVESIPLISASIMSKKLAEGLTGLVLDVKNGSGAFLPELERDLALAETMIRLGRDRGCPVVALVTAMDRPLGRACGNALEVEEAIAALKGEGPPDLLNVTYALGAEMLVLGGAAPSRDAARRAMEVAISSGRAAEKFQQIIEAQGGNPGVVDDPAALPQALACELYAAPGRGVVALGGGRTRIDDAVDPAVGFVITAKPGDWVEAGEPLATIFARDHAGIDAGRAALRQAIRIADEVPAPLPLISHRVSAAGVEAY